jgi:undecaprenyl-diphosphatase
MHTIRLEPTLSRFAALELAACRSLQARTGVAVQQLFATVSHLGDGWLWGGIALLLALTDTARALPALAQMAVAAAVGLPLYKLLKRGTARPRPCAAAGEAPLALVRPLDLHSFPSGHTLHAVAFTLVLLGHYPLLAWVLVPFTALVALSRIVLGLHYPSDVLAGAMVGTGVGLLAQAWG